MATAYVTTILLPSGPTRRVYRDHVSHRALAGAGEVVAAVFDADGAPVPVGPGYELTGYRTGSRTLSATLWWAGEGPRPVATIGIALGSWHGARLWRAMTAIPSARTDVRAPGAPWGALAL